MTSFSIDSDERSVAMSYQNIGENISIDKRWNSIFNQANVADDKITSSEQTILENSVSSTTREDDSDRDEPAPTIIIVEEPEEPIITIPIAVTVIPPYTGPISCDRITKLQSLLECIRIKPATLKDFRDNSQLVDGEVQLCDACHTGPAPESSACSYGISNKSGKYKVTNSKLVSKTGKTYGQDYIYADKNRIFESDGHGFDGELYAAFSGMRFPHYANHSDMDVLLASGDYTATIKYIRSVFASIESDILKFNEHSPHVNGPPDPGCLEDILKSHSVHKEGGTTSNYCSLHNITSDSGVNKRFIVAANVGDSETYAIMRFPDGSRKIKVLSATHSVENIDEATRIINSNTTNVDSIMPIYSRFNTYDIYGKSHSPFPPNVIPHIDHIPVDSPFPIYNILDDGSIEVNGETLHKLQMGLGAFGRAYNISDWYGGIQALRTNVIEKYADGTWSGVAPLSLGDPSNYGSTPNGKTQSTRAFGDLVHEEYISAVPHVCILQVPDNVHLTIISSSDGYGDVVHLSEVADEVAKTPYGLTNAAKQTKTNLIRLMYTNITGKAVKGYSVNNMLQPMWDDVSFGLIDSPPYV